MNVENQYGCNERYESMNSQHDDNLWILIHLPKSGGTTFDGHCKRHLDFDSSYISLSYWGRSYREKHHRVSLEERSDHELKEIRVISGHQTWYGIHYLIPQKTPKYLTIIRDPAARIVSRYNFDRSRKRTTESFDSWYQQYTEKRRNPMIRFYSERLMRMDLSLTPQQHLDVAKKLLDRCSYIALTENLQKDFSIIFSQMKLPTQWTNHRVAGYSGDSLEGLNHAEKGWVLHKYQRLNNNIQEQVYEDHSLDKALYDYAVTLRSAYTKNESII